MHSLPTPPTWENAYLPTGEAANSTTRSLFHILSTSDWQKHVKKRPRRNVPHFLGRTPCHPEGTRGTQPTGPSSTYSQPALARAREEEAKARSPTTTPTWENATSPKGGAANSTNRSLFHILTTSYWHKHVKKRPRRNVPHFLGRTFCHPEGTRITQPTVLPPHTLNQYWREHVKRRPRRTYQQQRLPGRTPTHPNGRRRTQPTGRFSTYFQPAIGKST